MTEEEWLACVEPLKLAHLCSRQTNSQRFKYLAVEWGKRIRESLDLHDRLWFDAFVAWINGVGNYPELFYDDGFDYFPRKLRSSQWEIYADQFMKCLQAGKLLESAAYAAESASENRPAFSEPVNFDKEHRGRSLKKRHAENTIREARRQKWNAECFAISERVRREFCDHCRDIFGNPFRPVTLNHSWLTPTVLALANGIYDKKAFEHMPILADALQDAGCDNEDILNHCREPGEHVRGCWCVDLLLGRE